MAQDKPTEFPEWASSPPASTITSPTTPTRQAGWQPGFLRRQYQNWQQNLNWQWLVWLDMISSRVMNLFFPSQAFNEGTIPTASATLVSAAAAFSGRVCADGWVIGPISSPAFTYAASKDTYWDLRRDGTWISTAVNNSAGAPAVAANSTRVYMVATDGTNKTAVTDFRVTHPRIDQVFDFDQIRIGEYLRSSAANLNLARLFAKWKGGAGSGYTLIGAFENDAGDLIGCRLYMRHSDGSLCVVRGASYSPGGDEWPRDAGASLATMEVIGRNKEFHSLNFSVVSDPFPDSEWYDTGTLTNGRTQQMTFNGTIKAGTNLNRSDFERGLFKFVASSFGGGIREGVLDAGPFQLYALPDAAQGTDGIPGNGGELTVNCKYNFGTSKYDYVDASDPFAFKIDFSDYGVRIWNHAGSDHWDDAESASNWGLVSDLSNGVFPSIKPTITLGATAPDKNVTYANNVYKAHAKIVTHGSGSAPTIASAFNVSAAVLVGSNTLQVTFRRPFASVTKMIPQITMGVAPGSAGGIPAIDDTDTTVTDLFIVLRSDAGSLIALDAGGVDRTFNIHVDGEQ